MFNKRKEVYWYGFSFSPLTKRLTMEYRRFEDHVQQLVPEFVLKQFAHLLRAIPENFRNDFVSRVRKYNDISRALDWLAFSAGVKNKPILEYAHQRMQDNMSEILD